MLLDNNEYVPCVKRNDHLIGKISNMPQLEKIEIIKLKVDMFGVKGEFVESCFDFLLRMHTIEFIRLFVPHSLMI